MQAFKNITSRPPPCFVPIPCHAIVRQGSGGTIPYSLITIHSTMFLGVLKLILTINKKETGNHKGWLKCVISVCFHS